MGSRGVVPRIDHGGYFAFVVVVVVMLVAGGGGFVIGAERVDVALLCVWGVVLRGSHRCYYFLWLVMRLGSSLCCWYCRS